MEFNSANSKDIYDYKISNYENIHIGEYVNFGKYLGQPILWRIINKDSNSILLFSKHILDFKAFDAAESGKGANAFSLCLNGFKIDTNNTNKFGSNNWETSNLREWLNSRGKVEYSTKAPDKSSVTCNEYANENGFLHEFNDDEVNMIRKTNHKVLLSRKYINTNSKGCELHKNRATINNAVSNYDLAYSKEISDKIFLLSIKQLKEYLHDREWEFRGSPTEKAINNLSVNDEQFSIDTLVPYWLNTPAAKGSCRVRAVLPGAGFIADTAAYLGEVGVRPALSLNYGFLFHGTGKSINPYTIKFGGM
jgi:hypothetical protein